MNLASVAEEAKQSPVDPTAVVNIELCIKEERYVFYEGEFRVRVYDTETGPEGFILL